MHNLYLIIRREYLERVARKSFIITTLVMPILMVALMAAPALIMSLSGPEEKTVAVVDCSGQVGRRLHSTDGITFLIRDADAEADPQAVASASDYDAMLVIGDDVVDNPDNVRLYTTEQISMQTEMAITDQITDAVEDLRLKRIEQDRDIEGLAAIIESIHADVAITTVQVSDGSEKETSSAISYIVGVMAAMMLYMFIMLYGNQVMTSIIDEKSSRVLEVIVSSVRPSTLMLGKILGIAFVALTQLAIWGALIAGFSYWGMPLIAAGADVSGGEFSAIVAQLGDTASVLAFFGCAIAYMVGGFLLYASIYAAIGSAVDNIQDASQLTSFAVMPIVVGLLFSLMAATDPNSTLSMWMSLIPFTSPMVMMGRLAFGVPAWQIAVSLALLFATFAGMVWVTAKIYRVGIFMYGKRPSIKDLVRWARYK